MNPVVLFVRMERLSNTKLKDAKEFAKILGRASVIAPVALAIPAVMIEQSVNTQTAFAQSEVCQVNVELNKQINRDSQISTLQQVIPCNIEGDINVDPRNGSIKFDFNPNKSAMEFLKQSTIGAVTGVVGVLSFIFLNKRNY